MTEKQKELINFIRAKLKKEPLLKEWFEDILKKVNWAFYEEMPEWMKKKYILSMGISDDTTEFRACCYSVGHIFYKKRGWAYKTYKDEYDNTYQKSGIVLNNNNETLESNAWVFLHELGHAFINQTRHSMPLYLISLLNYKQERYIEKETGEFYWDLYNQDYYHEIRPEEQFCNLIANIIIGKELDRHWWRKHCYEK